jgi:hypothetical protein
MKSSLVAAKEVAFRKSFDETLLAVMLGDLSLHIVCGVGLTHGC